MRTDKGKITRPDSFDRALEANNRAIDRLRMSARMNIYEQFEAANVQMDHHESDLYVPVNETTRAIVEAYEFKGNVTTFQSAMDGQMWYDLPFAYEPYWENGLDERHMQGCVCADCSGAELSADND